MSWLMCGICEIGKRKERALKFLKYLLVMQRLIVAQMPVSFCSRRVGLDSVEMCSGETVQQGGLRGGTNQPLMTPFPVGGFRSEHVR